MGKNLSKSKYCKGLQCPKILWLDEHRPELADVSDNKSVLEEGKRVGELAREYFGSCSLVEFNYDLNVMVEDTFKLMNSGCECIAEASFIYDGLFCSVDILRKCESGHDLIEVKSSTSVSEIHIEDVSYQYYVLINSGIPINHVYIMHINNQYVRQGELDLQSLFVMEECTDKVKMRQEKIEDRIEQIRTFIDTEDEPERDINIYCENPYKCAYYSYCHRDIPKQSVFDIKDLRFKRKYELYHQGIVTFKDIIEKRPKMGAKQMEQVETAYYHKPDVINREEIREFINTLYYPVYHLDFETFQMAVPEYNDLKPYEKIPFQYSLHIEKEDGTLEHREFLGEEGTDPRRKLAEQLVNDIPEDSCILAFNMSFEKGVIERLAEMYGDLAEHLMNIHDHISDLMIPFEKKSYYTAAMEGSYSIKYVLPALFPDDPSLDYHNLEGIHHGGEASDAFKYMTRFTPEERAKTRENLLKYCGLDTYAMVKVLEKLREAAKEN